MMGRVILSLLLAGSLGAATVRVPMSPCVVTNTPGAQACHTGCCANMTCCKTSKQRTSAPAQALAKAAANQDLAAVAVIALANPLRDLVVVPVGTSLRERTVAPLPPARVLLCTFLI